MNPKLVSISSTSHKKMWREIDVTPKIGGLQTNSGFIFSTAKTDAHPSAVLEFPADYLAKSRRVCIRNRVDGGRSVAARIIGLVVEASENQSSWRSLPVQLTEDFIYGGDRFTISMGPKEKFLKFSLPNAQTHFHIGSIEAPIEDFPDYVIEMEFKAFAKVFGRMSNSQRLQDIFALFVNGFQHNYFLEFGAADGVSLSNTLLLEVVGWDGVCGEALSSFFDQAKQKRRCKVVNHALAGKSGEILEFKVSGLLSSLSKTASKDLHSTERNLAESVFVTTKRLDEILLDNRAPSTIGFLSLDIEGAELEVLSSFPFDRYRFNCAAIEHNHSNDEAKIDHIMKNNDYERVLGQISGHDAFYIHKSHQRYSWMDSGLRYIRPHQTGQQIIDSLYNPVQQ